MLWKKEYITKNRTFYRVESLDHFKRRTAFNLLDYEDLMKNEELMHKLLGNRSFVYIFPSYNYVDEDDDDYVDDGLTDTYTPDNIPTDPDSIDGELIPSEIIEATINIIDTSNLTNNNENKKSDWKNIWLGYYCFNGDDSKWDDEFSEWYENKRSMPWIELSELSHECNNKELYKDGELTEYGTLWLLNNSSILKKMKLKPRLLLNILNYSDVAEKLEDNWLNDYEDNY